MPGEHHHSGGGWPVRRGGGVHPDRVRQLPRRQLCLCPARRRGLCQWADVGCVHRDGCGRPADDCAFTVTVLDRQPPQITFAPADVTVECGTVLIPANTGGSATAADACDPSPVVASVDGGAIAGHPGRSRRLDHRGAGLPGHGAGGARRRTGTPPLGAGQLPCSIGANGENLAEMRNSNFDQVPLAALTELGYWTYRTVDGAGLNRNIYLILNVDTDGDGSGDDVIYFDPRYQHGSNPVCPIRARRSPGSGSGGTRWWAVGGP